jgi:hypothetical protein
LKIKREVVLPASAADRGFSLPVVLSELSEREPPPPPFAVIGAARRMERPPIRVDIACVYGIDLA